MLRRDETLVGIRFDSHASCIYELVTPLCYSKRESADLLSNSSSSRCSRTGFGVISSGAVEKGFRAVDRRHFVPDVSLGVHLFVWLVTWSHFRKGV